MKTWYELEIMIYVTKTWRKVSTLVGGLNGGFITVEDAQDFISSMSTWGDVLYKDCTIKIVKYTSEDLSETVVSW